MNVNAIESLTMRPVFDLSGYWDGEIKLTDAVDVVAPATIRKPLYMPLPWNVQTASLRWPSATQELSGVVRTVQNQNFRDVQRKFDEGVVTYRRSLSIPDHPGRLFLVCEGANDTTTLTWNGQQIGEHAGSHLGFEMEVTDAARSGANGDTHDIEIEVDNLRRRDRCPQEQYNWRSFGGVYRPIRLEWRPRVFVQHVSVQPGRDGQQWFVDVAVSLSDPAAGEVKIEIQSGDETVVAHVETATGERTCKTRVQLANPVVWQPGVGGMSAAAVSFTPGATGKTGDVVASDAPSDRFDVSFGIRTVEVVGRSIHVNGKAVRLLGAAMHEQHPTFGASLPAWQAEADLDLLLYAGFNAVRTAHYPHAQTFYDACDRRGVLCVAELPCWQFDEWHFERDEVRDYCANYARRMVEQMGHHPSIIGWVIQNESKTFDPRAKPFFAAIADAFRQADPTRLLWSAESPAPPEHLKGRKAGGDGQDAPPPDKLPATADLPDVFGVNNYSGWYHDKASALPELLDRVREKLGDRPMMVTEFGAEGILGERSLTMAPWTEDFQTRLLERHIAHMLSRDDLAGFFLWLFIDYECSSIGIRGINAKGLVDMHRRPKLAYDVIRALLQAAAGDCG